MVEAEYTQAACVPTNILLQTQSENLWLLSNEPLQSPQLHNEANVMCKLNGLKHRT